MQQTCVGRSVFFFLVIIFLFAVVIILFAVAIILFAVTIILSAVAIILFAVTIILSAVAIILSAVVIILFAVAIILFAVAIYYFLYDINTNRIALFISDDAKNLNLCCYFIYTTNLILIFAFLSFLCSTKLTPNVMQLVAVPLAISLLKYVIFLINHYRLQKKLKQALPLTAVGSSYSNYPV